MWLGGKSDFKRRGDLGDVRTQIILEVMRLYEGSKADTEDKRRSSLGAMEVQMEEVGFGRVQQKAERSSSQ